MRWFIEPRMIEVQAPSVELTIQDLVDTVRDFEYSWAGMSHPKLLNATGKEALGGGLFVGITAELQNADVLFEANTVIVSAGTITTDSGTPVRRAVRLIDSGATFIADGVEPGAVVFNSTDINISEVLNVMSETELMVGIPTNGAGNDYDIGDAYSIFSVIRPVIRGGNLVAVDEVGAPIIATVTSAFTQLIVEKASASTLLSADTALLVSLEKLQRNKLITDPIAGTITIFDDDDTTVLFTAPIFQDAAGTIPYAGSGAERRERLV